MKKKYMIYIVVLILIIFISIFMIFRCNDKSIIKNINYESRSKEEIMQLVSDEHIDSLVVNEYSNSDLKKIESINLDLESLDVKYVIECIRNDTSLPESYYRVVYRSKKAFLFVYFNDKGEKLYSFIYRMSKEKNDFDFVEIGKTKKISIFLLGLGKSEWAPMHSTLKTSRYSRHYTKDGYVITFEYNENGIVADKKVEII